MHASRLLALFLLLFAGSGVAGAQVRLAEIAGTVTDESGGVLPGVTVTALHVDTGQSRTAVTEAGGTYLITALPVGRYRISAELSGFRGVIFEDVLLEIGNSLRLDVKMQVATVEESITVSGEAPLVDTTKSDLTGRINQRQVESRRATSACTWTSAAASATAGHTRSGCCATTRASTSRTSPAARPTSRRCPTSIPTASRSGARVTAA